MSKQDICQQVRGTKDLIGEEMRKYLYIRDTFKKIASRYGIEFMQTSAMDSANLFMQTSGEEADICQKEMFEVKHCSNVLESTAQEKETKTILKPEGTAPAIRALLNQNYQIKEPLRVCYFDRMYRYCRPQKGRLRELTQAGVEMFNRNNNILADFDCISMAVDFLKELKVFNYLTLKINNIGKASIRERYMKKLREYLDENKEHISNNHPNPLRVLDKLSNEEKSKLNNIPKLYDFLPEEEKVEFENLLKLLDQNGIRYELDHTIVRGLDYYNGVVFEFMTNATTAQNTVLAGGRYDGLVKKLSDVYGKREETGAVGWGSGVDRLMILMDEMNVEINSDKSRNVLFIDAIEDVSDFTFLTKIIKQLRDKEVNVNVMSASIKKGLKYANEEKITYVIICGNEELESKKLILKNMLTGEQETFDTDNIEKISKKIL